MVWDLVGCSVFAGKDIGSKFNRFGNFAWYSELESFKRAGIPIANAPVRKRIQKSIDGQCLGVRIDLTAFDSETDLSKPRRTSLTFANLSAAVGLEKCSNPFRPLEDTNAISP
jgi:hypothetical protein